MTGYAGAASLSYEISDLVNISDSHEGFHSALGKNM